MKKKVSVIVLTYNADLEKLKNTVRSVLYQNYRDFELIIADDGSKVKWNREIENLVSATGEFTLKFADSPVNGGTVKNVLNGLSLAEGDYVKLISPGDYLEKNVLESWVRFSDAHPADATFGNAVYHRFTGNAPVVLRHKNAPANLRLYETGKPESPFTDCLLGNDGILGCTFMMKRDVMTAYVREMAGKVRFAEDYMLRLMVFDGRTILHYPETVIWYEYGEGVSTTKEARWAKLLHDDFDAVNALIRDQHTPVSKKAEKYQRFLRFDGSGNLRKIRKVLAFPGVLYWRILAKISPSKTPEATDTAWLSDIQK